MTHKKTVSVEIPHTDRDIAGVKGKPAIGHGIDGLEEILGIERIRSVDIHIKCGELVTATVEFVLDEIQAKAVVALFGDGKWRSHDE